MPQMPRGFCPHPDQRASEQSFLEIGGGCEGFLQSLPGILGQTGLAARPAGGGSASGGRRSSDPAPARGSGQQAGCSPAPRCPGDPPWRPSLSVVFTGALEQAGGMGFFRPSDLTFFLLLVWVPFQ